MTTLRSLVVHNWSEKSPASLSGDFLLFENRSSNLKQEEVDGFLRDPDTNIDGMLGFTL